MLAYRRVRNRHEIFRIPDRREVQSEDERRKNAGRRHVRSGARPEYEMAGNDLRFLRRIRLFRNRMRDTGKRHRRCVRGEFKYSPGNRGGSGRRPHSPRDLRRYQVHRQCMREAGSLYGYLLCAGMSDHPWYQL